MATSSADFEEVAHQRLNQFSIDSMQGVNVRAVKIAQLRIDGEHGQLQRKEDNGYLIKIVLIERRKFVGVAEDIGQ